ncbi:hypothetical protein B4133_0200 [Bacillus altitudinis]|nr:hypothetical protein B4133_0200 [Bacillus altitudinis]
MCSLMYESKQQIALAYIIRIELSSYDVYSKKSKPLLCDLL